MKNAKKNILSWLKAMKERLFGTLQKPQSENEKNLQNTAREEKSSSSKPAKEITKSADAEIYGLILECKFVFGGQEHTVGEAGLMFTYEVGIDLSKIYVIALTEKFGTIVFHIPEETTEKIADRVAELPGITFQGYVAIMVEHGAEITTLSLAFHGLGISVAEVAESMRCLAAAAYKASTLSEYAVDTKTAPNNWLKMHGYPMRRKVKGKKKHE